MRLPGQPQLLKGRQRIHLRPVNAQVDHRPRVIVHHLHRRRVDRPGLAPGDDPGAQPGQQPAGQLSGGGLKGAHHRGDYPLTGQHVTRRHAVIPRQGAADPEGELPAEHRRVAVGVNRRDLAIFAEAILRQGQVQGLLNAGPRFERAEDLRPQRRQGYVLTGDRADAGQ